MNIARLVFPLLLAATTASATESCIDLDVRIIRYDSMNNLVGQTSPRDTVFNYGDLFTLLIDGTLPGTFYLQNIDPAGKHTWVPEDGRPAYSDGTDLLLFPCGLPGMCETGSEKFHLDDKLSTRPMGSVSDETLIIYYLPCRTGEPEVDSDIAHLAERVPYCTGLPAPFPKDHRISTMRNESITMVDPENRRCDLPADGEAIMLFERITMTAQR